MRPADYDYEMLRRKLMDYRRIASAGEYWSAPVTNGLPWLCCQKTYAELSLIDELRSGYSASTPGGVFATAA